VAVSTYKKNCEPVLLFFLVVLLFFVSISLLKMVGAQVQGFFFQTNHVTLGQEPAGYVSVPVAWEPGHTQPVSSTGQAPIYLKPQQQRGQLEVPVFSGPGLLMLLIGLAGLITTVWTLGLLLRIFTTTQRSSPFQVSNARRITLMGILFLGQTFIEVVLKLILWFQTRPYFKQLQPAYGNSLSVDLTLDGPWLLGLIVLALAQIYRKGIEFQQENELTVLVYGHYCQFRCHAGPAKNVIV
jgi:hypothetical protein